MLLTPPPTCSHPPDQDSRATTELLASASRIVQAQSALFLLVRSSRAPDLDELQSTTAQVRTWVEATLNQFHELTGISDCPAADRLGALVAALQDSQRVLERFVPFRSRQGTQVSAAAALAAISAAHECLQAVRPYSAELVTDLFSSCCAADVTHISRQRNHYECQ